MQLEETEVCARDVELRSSESSLMTTLVTSWALPDAEEGKHMHAAQRLEEARLNAVK